MNNNTKMIYSYLKKRYSGLICLIMAVLFMSGPAFAHKVTIFAWVEGDMVYTESKFSGGKRAKNALVEVYDGKGNKLLKGKTDENGAFSFKAPQKTEMKIVLPAGMGHRGEWTISADEFQGNDSPGLKTDDTVREQSLKMPEKPDEKETVNTETRISEPCLTHHDIEHAVEQALDRKLKPVITQLNRSLNPDEEPSFSEIIGGIGYIIGLIGIGTYFNYRRKKD